MMASERQSKTIVTIDGPRTPNSRLAEIRVHVELEMAAILNQIGLHGSYVMRAIKPQAVGDSASRIRVIGCETRGISPGISMIIQLSDPASGWLYRLQFREGFDVEGTVKKITEVVASSKQRPSEQVVVDLKDIKQVDPTAGASASPSEPEQGTLESLRRDRAVAANMMKAMLQLMFDRGSISKLQIDRNDLETYLARAFTQYPKSVIMSLVDAYIALGYLSFQESTKMLAVAYGGKTFFQQQKIEIPKEGQSTPRAEALSTQVVTTRTQPVAPPPSPKRADAPVYEVDKALETVKAASVRADQFIEARKVQSATEIRVSELKKKEESLSQDLERVRVERSRAEKEADEARVIVNDPGYRSAYDLWETIKKIAPR
jgi:hypothetical protein